MLLWLLTELTLDAGEELTTLELELETALDVVLTLELWTDDTLDDVLGALEALDADVLH